MVYPRKELESIADNLSKKRGWNLSPTKFDFCLFIVHCFDKYYMGIAPNEFVYNPGAKILISDT